MKAEIFREYDIRGVVVTDLTPDVVRVIGRAIGTYVGRRQKGRRIVVGRDVRLSSPAIASALIDGLVATGAEVTDVGVVPTPALYFAHHDLGTDGAVMITGSHNPPEFNGMKILSGSDTLFGPTIQEIREIAEAGDFDAGAGTVGSLDIVGRYTVRLVRDIRIGRKLKLVVDAGSGTAGPIAPGVIEGLGCSVVNLYCEPDGRFPHHHPDPTIAKNLVDLQRTVKETGADAGIAYDGDADRIGVVDQEANIIWGDRLLALYARSLLAREPVKVVFEVKCSQALVEDIEARGGTPIMWKAGHSLIKQKMKEEHAPLGGEMSGHMFFADRWYGFDDAIYASLRLLEILGGQKGSLSSLLADLPQYPSTPELRVGCPDDAKFKVVDEVKTVFAATYPCITVDGVRVLFGDGWGLVRASNTQPAIVVRFEARTPERLAEIQRIVLAELEKFPSVERLTHDTASGHA